jgi:hypothetical protein
MTPRSLLRARDPRAIGTLIGNGWLRESPRDAGLKWEMRGGKSALRKCVFMPVPEQLRGLFPQVSASALPPVPVYRPIPAEDVVPHRRDPRKDVRELAAFAPAPYVDPRAVAQRAHAEHVQNAQRAAMAAASGRTARGAWWEDPVALGSLLIVLPPIGLAAVWSSKRYSNDARWALTIMTGLTMCLVTAIVIAVFAMTR